MISDGKFRKSEHILKSKEFRVVYKKGLAVKNGPAVLCYIPNALAHNRLGFSISSRSTRLASRRNRARRLFREVYRLQKHRIRSGFDMVLVLKRPLPEKTAYTDAQKIFMKLIFAAGLLYDKHIIDYSS